MNKQLVFLLLVMVLALSGCDRKTSRLRQKNLNGVHIGLLAGSMQEQRAKSVWQKGLYTMYDTNEEAITALKNGEVEALYIDALAMYNKAYDEDKLDVAFFDNDHMPIAGALRQSDVWLERLFADYMKRIKANGHYIRMKNRWTVPDCKDIAPLELPKVSDGPDTRTLTVGIVGEMPPYSVNADGRWTGFENELWEHFAASIGYRIEFEVYDLKDILPALVGHKVDVIAAALTVTEQRSRKVLFTAPYAYSCSVCLCRR